MEIGYASPEDTGGIRLLWKRCFGDSETYLDIFFGTLYRPENTLLARRGAEIAAMLHIVPCGYASYGTVRRGGYICGACTAPEYRMQGVMRMLLQRALADMTKWGMEAAFLIPTVHGFYEKFGFSYRFYKDYREMKASSYAGCAGVVQTVREAGALREQYELFASRCGVALCRDDAWWRAAEALYLKPEGCGAACSGQGYAVYEKRGTQLWVRELAAPDAETEKALVGGLCARYPMCETVHIADYRAEKPFGMALALGQGLLPDGPAYMNLMLD